MRLWYDAVTASDRYRMAKTAQRASGAKRVERGRNGAAKISSAKEEAKLSSKQTETDRQSLLGDVEFGAGDDVARMLELLLLENHILRLQASPRYW